MPVLNFKGKTAVDTHHHTVPHHVLEVDRKLSELPKGEAPSLDGNLIIEGDNLLALKSLLPTHAGKVKCIYIDPPYNTGNEGWIYNDNLTQPQFKEWIGREVGREGEDACRHDKWCCMMYPRLQLLRELLREDGSIWISIDDNEVHHLRAIMDEVFGTTNFVACFVWQKRYSRENRPPVGVVHDYIVVYSRMPDTFGRIRNRLPPSEESRAVYRNPNNDPKGDWRPIPITAQEGHATKEQFYEIVGPTGKVHRPPPGRCWGLSRETFETLRREGRIYFGKDGTAQPNVIRYWSEVEGFVPWTWWPHEEVGNTDEAKKELFEFFAKDSAFDSPKPTRLVRRILEIYTSPKGGDIVLDSFAGSGTTGHSVMALNSEDGGDRKFVLVQMPHDMKTSEAGGLNICRDIAAERLRKVVRGYTTSRATAKGNEKRVTVPGLGGSFTYVRVGPPLLGDYRNWGETLPSYEDLARYVFFTETGTELDPKKGNRKTGKIGERGNASYYLLYTPDPKASVPLDQKALDDLAQDKNPRKVVYCEKVWAHREDLQRMRKEVGDVRTMLLPFQVKGS